MRLMLGARADTGEDAAGRQGGMQGKLAATSLPLQIVTQQPCICTDVFRREPSTRHMIQLVNCRRRSQTCVCASTSSAV